MSFDLSEYRGSAESFVEKIDREYYLHLAGHKPDLEIEEIYERHAELFEPEAVERLRESLEGEHDGDERRRLRYLLRFAFDGHIGQATKAEAEELARLEASLEVQLDGSVVGFRQVPIELANEPDAELRAALEAARDELLVERLNPLHVIGHERAQEIARRFGWPSYAAACAELSGIDLPALAGQAEAFLEATEAAYPLLVDPHLEAAGLARLGELRRADVARFLRAPELDALYPDERSVEAFEATMHGLGLDLRSQRNVHLDLEPRPTKSPRAFCSPVRVPDEVYLMVAPVGGREDYAALFHEGGHTEHYANTAAALPFEFRHLGDNSVTESFAFLIEHVTEDRGWLRARLGVEDGAAAAGQARATRLLFLRRYAAKINYELELCGERSDLDRMPARYAERVGTATRVHWPEAGWASDVDAGFYVACYLRAWALETYWRSALGERFGERWFESPQAGAWLRELWAQGQRLDAEELLRETLGEQLDFGVLVGEFEAQPASA